jgi:hypothetical protein
MRNLSRCIIRQIQIGCQLSDILNNFLLEFSQFKKKLSNLCIFSHSRYDSLDHDPLETPSAVYQRLMSQTTNPQSNNWQVVHPFSDQDTEEQLLR